MTEETSIQQTISEINVQLKGSIVIKKDSFILIFLPSATFSLRIYMHDVIQK
jgi:hypothetical protein